MRNVLNLLKLQIDNKTDLLKTKTPKKMLLAILKIVAIMTLVSILVWFIEGQIFILGINVNAELLAIILLLTQIISLMFAIGSIIGTLYLNKDNEMLICFPVSSNQLFLSKILLIYLKELAINSLLTIPIFVGLGIIGELGVCYFITLPLLLLLLPILPIALASFLSIIIMIIFKYLKKHTILSIIVILSLVLGCLICYVMLVGNIMENFNIATEQIKTVKKINRIVLSAGKHIAVFYQLGMAMLDFSKWYYLLVLILLCVVLFGVTILINKPFYFKTAMSSFENTSKPIKGVKVFKKSSPFISLIKKEICCIFRSPSELFEYFLFTLLMPFIVFTYDKLLMSISVTKAGVNMIAGSHVMVVAIIAMLSNIISASAISKEGNTFYISKVVPVSYYTQIFAKLTFNIIFTAGALGVTLIVSCFIYPWWQMVLSVIAILFASIGHAAMSIDMDIKNPSKNFQGDEKSSAVSKSTSKSIVWGLIIGFLMGFTVISMATIKHTIIPYIILIVFGLVFMIRKIYVLILRINMQYDKIEM